MTKTARILFAEDNPLGAGALCRLLGLHGYQITHKMDGASALTLFEADPSQWDMLITDLVMPKLSGFDLIKRIRELKPSFPVIVTSGHLSDKEMDRLYDLAVEDILAKPIHPDQLLALIQARLESD